MARYDKYDPKNGGYRATLASDYDPDDVEQIIGIGHDANGRLVKGAGASGITAVLVLTKAYKAGTRVDPMTSGEITEFGPTGVEPGVDFGKAGTVYYSDSDGNIVAGLDEVQVITATSGSTPVTLSWNSAGPQSVAAGANASLVTAAQIKAALEALSNIDVGDVEVAGATGGPWTVTFGGQYADANVPAITGTNVSVSTSTAGGATTGLVRVGHTVEAQRLIVRVEH